MAILPQFIDLEHSVPKQVLILGITSVVIETSILFSYGALASKIEAWAVSKNSGNKLNLISGSTLILVGLSLTLLQVK